MIATQRFGRSAHLSTRTILGAAGLGKVTQAEADAALELAFAHGVNHIDTAESYHDSELRLGSWIRRHGKTFFLGTKTEERTAAKARESIHRSLERLHVDAVDLFQFHNLVDPQAWEIALGPGGALEAAVEARQQGLVRHIGVTGHGLTVAAMHFRALDRFPFDSVLLPLNWVLARNVRYLADFQRLVTRCQAQDVAVMTIKSIVRGPWGDIPRTRTTWYQPLEDEREIALAVGWVLGHAGVFLNTASDTHLLPLVLAAAEGATQPPDDAEMGDQAARLGMTSLFVA
jgi:aryl-alcohol dehydrogenase-like predicted oxidoreductase